MKPVVLMILDGVGVREQSHGNAVKQANTPNLDKLFSKYNSSLLEASGKDVGLPVGIMGNSEVGHMNIGAGRIVYQSLQLINEKIEDKTFFQNESFLKVFNHVKQNNSRLHLMGLLSDGGIHSTIEHLFALIEMAKNNGIEEIYIHSILDGRDTLPRVALTFLNQLNEKIEELKIGKIATLHGRYYAMDRDNRWDRIEKSYQALVYGNGEIYNTYKDAIESNYKNNIDDEFIIPAVLDKEGVIKENDGIIWFNYRPDRSRELPTTLTNPNFSSFKKEEFNNLFLVTMMPVSEDVHCIHAFQLETLENTFGEYISNLGLKQLRIAETEKYAHVTYFFDGGIEKELPNCKRILIPSPQVPTYDLKPEMSAYEITDTLLQELDNDYDYVILNYANGDMVGHTGDFKATVKAMETLDECVLKVYEKIKEKDGILVIVADHGNADYMLDDDDRVITSHSLSKVPFLITKEGISLENGRLSDITPTLLRLKNLPIPQEMKGNVLYK